MDGLINIMKPKITREYEKDRHRNNEDETDFREFIFVDGKKVYKYLSNKVLSIFFCM